ncbi:hypothetical protein SDC9_192115 [bioreactor metagenome]|uniref:Uncharacterized protein n=1 Tax=bioreactor metagenome TaxID=1076179 RepID=A0A645I058_9ZZZZ
MEMETGRRFVKDKEYRVVTTLLCQEISELYPLALAPRKGAAALSKLHI